MLDFFIKTASVTKRLVIFSESFPYNVIIAKTFYSVNNIT